MSILVTGGVGLIGAFVTRHLVERGVRPVLYDLRFDAGFLKGLEGQYDFVSGDVTSLPRLLETIDEYEVQRIIHTAWILAPESQANPPRAVSVNIGGTLNVLEAARLRGVTRVVFTSSKGLYGTIVGEYGHPTYKPYDEDYRKEPVVIYDATKQMAEQLGFNYRRDYNVDFIALRFAMPYGPGKALRHSKITTSQIIEAGLADVPFVLPQGGDQLNDYVYVKDAAAAIVSACFVEHTEHAAFNIGCGKLMSLRDLATAVVEIFPRAQITIGPGLDFLGIGRPIYGVMDISRARRELGFEPQYDFRAAVRDYVATVKELGLASSAVAAR